MSNYEYLSHHYHRVDSILWLEVRTFIRSLMVCRVEQGQDVVSVTLNRDMWQDLDEFVCQMECAYLHPRRDSHHIDKCMINYVGNAHAQSSRRSSSPCHPIHEKNLKPQGKGVGL